MTCPRLVYQENLRRKYMVYKVRVMEESLAEEVL